MYLISFDIGAKNLAFCLFKLNNKEYEIITWDVLDICVSNEKLTCNYLIIAGNYVSLRNFKIICRMKLLNKILCPQAQKLNQTFVIILSLGRSEFLLLLASLIVTIYILENFVAHNTMFIIC